MGYDKLPRNRPKNSDGSTGMYVEKQMYQKQPDVKKESSKTKEVTIETTVLDRDGQLNLLATLVEQIGDSISLNTPEFAYAKTKFFQIKTILDG